MAEFRLRAMEDGDWPALSAFARTHFGPSHLSERDFNEHWFGPVRHGRWIARVLQADDGRIAGFMLSILVQAKFGDTTAPLAWISNAAVEPEAKQKGAGAQFYLWIYKSFPLVGAMSGNEESLPINSVLGLDIPNTQMKRFIALHSRRTAELCLPEFRHRVLAHSFETGAECDSICSGRWVTGIPEDYDALWQSARERVFCTTERDRGHMAWRYEKAPYVEYKFLEVRFGSALKALAVVRVQETPAGRVARIVDFVSTAEADRQAWLMVAYHTRRMGAVLTDFMVLGTIYDSALERAGWQLADENTGLDAIPHLLSPVEHRQWTNTFHLGGALARSTSDWRQASAVYFTKGDSDRDWPTTYDLRQSQVAI